MSNQTITPSRPPAIANRAVLNAGVTVLIVIVVFSTIAALIHLHEQAKARVAITSTNLAKSIVLTLEGVIDTLDVAMFESSREISRQMAKGHVDAGAITAMLVDQRRHIPSVAHFRATDERGNIIYGPDIPVPPVNTADRDHFIQLRDNPNAGVVADKPFFGRISGRWVWTFARRINKPDGSFGGVTFSAVYLDEISKMLGKIKMAPGDSVSLRGGKYELIARYPAASQYEFPIGEQRFSAQFLEALSHNMREGTYDVEAARIDGIARTYAYYRSEKYGFLVNVGIGYDAAFAEWRRQAWIICILEAALVLALLTFTRAISRSWQRQEEALLSLQEAQQMAGLGQFCYDLQTGAWTSSEVFNQIFGIHTDYQRESSQWLALFNPKTQADMAAFLASAETLQYPDQREWRIIRHENGEERWIVCRSKLQHDRDNVALALVGTVQDISERKQTESDLRIAASAFESQEGMVVTDADSVILRVNRAFTETTGYTADEVVGKTPKVLNSGRHPKEFYREMWRSINLTGSWQGEIWDRRKNGEEYQKWLIISAVKDARGLVTNYIGAQVDITERKRAEEKINELAFYDQLTGLPNRTLLMDRLRQTMAVSDRRGAFNALVLIDLDNFKTLNDTLGHDMGDLLLTQVAQRLKSCARVEDTVARFGGDEFVLILPGLSDNEEEASVHTESVAVQILEKLNQPYQLNHVTYHCTPSIGASLFCGQQTEIDVLIKQADLAMYRSKDAGRNTFCFFDPSMEMMVMKRAALEIALREALDDNQFVLYYQPQVFDGILTGAEALVRWRHPTRGLVSPMEFIPVAEETGMIVQLGHHVLVMACQQLSIWAKRPDMAFFSVAVNVSAQQFHHPDFVPQLLEILDKTGAPPERLKLELTESVLAANVDELVKKMFAIKNCGVGFSLDDFGTGYSSLSFLKRLPLDQLKIDKSFVDDILVDTNAASIAQTIITLAENLGLGVLAEGVETLDQRDFLARVGCHAYQGYYLSRPLPLTDLEQFIADYYQTV